MTERKPRLLFLAHPFPPMRVIGAVRCWNLAKNLSRRGWSVEVVAPDPALIGDPEPGIDVISKCNAEGITCRWTGYDWRFIANGFIRMRKWERIPYLAKVASRSCRAMGIEPSIGWCGAALRACEGLRAGGVDVVLTSGSPFCSFSVAQRLSTRLNAPYVLDYRDPWTANPFSSTSHSKRLARLEGILARGAAGIIVVSEPWAEQMQERLRLEKRPVVITNGFEDDSFKNITPHRFEDFAVVYAGQFYPPTRTITPVLEAIVAANRSATPSRIPIRLHYYGTAGAHVMDVAAAMGATELCVNHGPTSRTEVFSALRGAGAVAVVVDIGDEPSPDLNAFVPGKLFEALASGVPTLVIGSPGSEAGKIVERANAGKTFTGGQVHEIADWLKALGAGATPISTSDVRQYGWDHLSERTDSFLRSVLEQFREKRV